MLIKTYLYFLLSRSKGNSIRSASSIETLQFSTHIQQIKQHTHWSLEVNTFEIFYLKPLLQEATSAAINESIVSPAIESNTTSPFRLESTKVLCLYELIFLVVLFEPFFWIYSEMLFQLIFFKILENRMKS